MLGGCKHVGGCMNEVGGGCAPLRTPPENPPVLKTGGGAVKYKNRGL